MRRYRFAPSSVPWSRIAAAIVGAVLLVDVILTGLVAWLVTRGGVP